MAGTGKTVAISEWLRCAARSGSVSAIGWVSLSEEHNDIGVFWGSLLASLELPELPESAAHAAERPWKGAELIADSFARLDGSPLVVLDNVHAIYNPVVLAGLAHLLERLPGHATIVVSSRFRPAIPWHQLDLAGVLVRAGPEDLAFTRVEVQALLDASGVQVEDAELDLILEISSGWPAIVRMTAQLLAAAEDNSRALTSVVASGHSVISDFLAGELLSSVSTEHRDFLTLTAVPDEFDTALATELAGTSASRLLSEVLDLQFPFVSTRSDGDETYRYHPLMRAYLRSELVRALGSDGVRRIELRAGHWYLNLRTPVAAIRHLLASDDRYGLYRGLLDLGPKAVLGPDAGMFLKTLDEAPVEVADDPWVHLLRSIHGIECGAMADADAFLQAASGRPSAICPPDLFDRLHCAVTIDLRTRFGENVPVYALPAAVADHREIEAYVAVQQAKLMLPPIGHNRVKHQLLIAVSRADYARCPAPHLEALTLLALLDGAHDQFVSMGIRALAAVRAATAAGIGNNADVVRCVVMCRYFHFLTGTQAPEQVETSFALSTGADGMLTPLAGWDWHALSALVMFPDSECKSQAARDIAEATKAALASPGAHPLLAPTVPLAIQALIAAHEYELAQRIVQIATTILGHCPEFSVASAMIEIADGRVRHCPQLLDAALSHPALRLVGGIQAHILRAVVAADAGQDERVLGNLESAIALAEPQHLVHPFLSLDRAVPLLDAYVGRFGRHDAFVDRIRTRPDAVHLSTNIALTPAERRVLQHLASPQSTQEIADTLCVSVNTVKTHLRGIYLKLGATSRRDAISAARVAGLL
ncbi:LuxR C-terminal-related transcriptional regulator [Dietzia sp. ANT_WB102]|uniref:helix-turn-helix transcriptional regulator n=1 Tax=Dietzia sp. ANT_WB102 TaxID=2597345 RepID=UPI0011EF85E0|nr:LuxR C-terminal-related transcriptional regulator [Dietzia sp. ANT_WB102]KAA0918419.1 hypothetical protein FQ137_03460 [Dietzia sp. ANT_WB102]